MTPRPHWSACSPDAGAPPLSASISPPGVDFRSSGSGATRVGPGVVVASELLWAERADEAATAYRARFAADPYDPVVAEARLNSLGYELLHRGRVAPAIAVFPPNVELRLASANARVSPTPTSPAGTRASQSLTTRPC